jgi:hypothetical protein
VERRWERVWLREGAGLEACAGGDEEGRLDILVRRSCDCWRCFDMCLERAGRRDWKVWRVGVRRRMSSGDKGVRVVRREKRRRVRLRSLRAVSQLIWY